MAMMHVKWMRDSKQSREYMRFPKVLEGKVPVFDGVNGRSDKRNRKRNWRKRWIKSNFHAKLTDL